VETTKRLGLRDGLFQFRLDTARNGELGRCLDDRKRILIVSGISNEGLEWSSKVVLLGLNQGTKGR